MQPTKTLRTVLVVSSLMAVTIGAALLVTPVQFHAGNGIVLGTGASELSEVRAPGAALLALGVLMGVGAFVRRFAFTSGVVTATVYLGYGLGRLVSFGLDGVPAPGLVTATAIELVTGAACVLALVHAQRRGAAATDAAPTNAHRGSAGEAA